MKKTITQWSMVVALTVGSLLNAQTTGVEDDKGRIGVNTNTPRATLDIQTSAENLTETATTNEGIIPPKISKTRLAQISNNRLVEGTIVYIDNVTYTATPANAKVAKVTEKGYYEYNGTQWQPLSTNIYGQDGYLTENRRVGLNAKNLNFAGGKIGRNISTPRSAVDLGNYDVLKLGGGIFSVDTNNGLIPPQMTKQYVYTMMEGVTDGIADGTIVYLSDLTAPWKTVCSPGGWLNFPICTDVPADLKPQMSEMTEKGLYIFNTEADKWLPLGERSNKHRLVDARSIKMHEGRTTITGTSGVWRKTGSLWRYEGNVRLVGECRPQSRTFVTWEPDEGYVNKSKIFYYDGSHETLRVNGASSPIDNVPGDVNPMTVRLVADGHLNTHTLLAPDERAYDQAVYGLSTPLAGHGSRGVRCHSRYQLLAEPVQQLWYYDE